MGFFLLRVGLLYAKACAGVRVGLLYAKVCAGVLLAIAVFTGPSLLRRLLAADEHGTFLRARSLACLDLWAALRMATTSVDRCLQRSLGTAGSGRVGSRHVALLKGWSTLASKRANCNSAS